MKYRKKHVEVEAFCLNGGAMPDWFLNARSAGTARTYAEGTGNPFNDPLTYAEVDTRNGTLRANRGDYIVQVATGELYTYKPYIFHKIYEEVK
jgi:hypothetical protein